MVKDNEGEAGDCDDDNNAMMLTMTFAVSKIAKTDLKKKRSLVHSNLKRH